jgi:hypothetical protein
MMCVKSYSYQRENAMITASEISGIRDVTTQTKSSG